MCLISSGAIVRTSGLTGSCGRLRDSRAGNSRMRSRMALARYHRVATFSFSAKRAIRYFGASGNWNNTIGIDYGQNWAPMWLCVGGQNRLAVFLREQAIELGDLYQLTGRSGWANLMRDVGLPVDLSSEEGDYLGRRFSSLLHIDDPLRLATLHKVGEPEIRYAPENLEDALLLQMLAYQVDGQAGRVGNGEAFVEPADRFTGTALGIGRTG